VGLLSAAACVAAAATAAVSGAPQQHQGHLGQWKQAAQAGLGGRNTNTNEYVCLHLSCVPTGRATVQLVTE
jgi:hypothetical protein